MICLNKYYVAEKIANDTYKIDESGVGVVNVYDDLDMNLDTITFETDTPTTAYALVYK